MSENGEGEKGGKGIFFFKNYVAHVSTSQDRKLRVLRTSTNKEKAQAGIKSYKPGI